MRRVGGWRDAGASHWISDLSAFSEERRALEGTELLVEECQGEMFGGWGWLVAPGAAARFL